MLIHGGQVSSDVVKASFSSRSAFVLKRQLHTRPVRLHFAVLNREVRLHNLGNAQVAQRSSGRLDCISCGILPGFGTRADYLRYFIYGVRSLSLFCHNAALSFILLLLSFLLNQLLGCVLRFSYSSGNCLLLIGPKAVAQHPFEHFAGAVLRKIDF